MITIFSQPLLFCQTGGWYGALYMKFGERGTVYASGGGGCKLMLQRRCRLLEREDGQRKSQCHGAVELETLFLFRTSRPR